MVCARIILDEWLVGSHAALQRRREKVFGAFNYPAAARLYFCPASSGLDAHDADACTGPLLEIEIRLFDGPCASM